MTACSPANRQVILMGRYPVPGQTKTRLIRATGALGAAELQRHMTERCLDTVTAAHSPDWVTFHYSGGSHDQVARWLGRYGIALKPQQGEDLGQRMQWAIDHALNGDKGPVVVVGTDLPELSGDHLQSAFDALKDNDLVIGPSRDGGYWLIGMSRRMEIFDGIDWGTSRVLAQTRAIANRLGLSMALLPVMNDIDTAADLKAWQPDDRWCNPYLSVIIPALNEAVSIKQTISAARSPDCEIIVADGGSTDGTVEVAHSCKVKVIQSPPGRARQQNAAAQMARGKVLLFLHADTRLPNHYGAHIFDAFLDPAVSAGAFRFKTDYEHRGMRLIEKAANLRSKLAQLPYGDQALFVPVHRFKKVGGFPDVAIAEDLLLVKRLGRLGHIHTASAAAITSGRRWREIGLVRTTIVNWIISAGTLLGLDPGRLAPYYTLWLRDKK
jgi:rSAM/selenodomain-associated transferase 2/rSAM/selenodomain-associated transferase 1